jgi:elongation factor G
MGDAMSLRESSVSLVMLPKTPLDRKRLDAALKTITAEDRDCHVLWAPNRPEVLVSARNLQHLEKVVDRLKREFLVEAALGRPTTTNERE